MKVKNQYLKIFEYLHLSFVVFLYRYERWIFTVYNHIIHKQFTITRFIFTSWVNGCCWNSRPLSPSVRPGLKLEIRFYSGSDNWLFNN